MSSNKTFPSFTETKWQKHIYNQKIITLHKMEFKGCLKQGLMTVTPKTHMVEVIRIFITMTAYTHAWISVIVMISGVHERWAYPALPVTPAIRVFHHRCKVCYSIQTDEECKGCDWRKRDMFYAMMQMIHFIYIIWCMWGPQIYAHGRIAHTTDYVAPVVKHWLEWEIVQITDNERLLLHRLLFLIRSNGLFICTKQDSTHNWLCYTSCEALAGTIIQITDNERLPLHGLLFLISSKGSFICTRQDSTSNRLCYTSCEALAGMRNSSITDNERLLLHILLFLISSKEYFICTRQNRLSYTSCEALAGMRYSSIPPPHPP